MDRDDWPDSDDQEAWHAFNLRGAAMSLQDSQFLHRLKFAAFSRRLGELLSRCDVPATELRFGSRTILVLRAPVGDPLHVTGQLLDPSHGPIRGTYLSIANWTR